MPIRIPTNVQVAATAMRMYKSELMGVDFKVASSGCANQYWSLRRSLKSHCLFHCNYDLPTMATRHFLAAWCSRSPVALPAPAVTRRDGLYLSFHVNHPAGPAMTLVATGLFILVASFRRRLFT